MKQRNSPTHIYCFEDIGSLNCMYVNECLHFELAVSKGAILAQLPRAYKQVFRYNSETVPGIGTDIF